MPPKPERSGLSPLPEDCYHSMSLGPSEVRPPQDLRTDTSGSHRNEQCANPPKQGGNDMARIARRKLLKLTGAGALAAKTGGMAAILAASRAPAYAPAATVHWLRWDEFIAG